MLLKEGTEIFLNPFFAPFEENGKRRERVTDSEVEQIVSDLLLAIGNLVIGNYAY